LYKLQTLSKAAHSNGLDSGLTQLVALLFSPPSELGRIKCCTRPSVRPVLRFYRNRKVVESTNLVERWKHSAGQE